MQTIRNNTVGNAYLAKYINDLCMYNNHYNTYLIAWLIGELIGIWMSTIVVDNTLPLVRGSVFSLG